MNFYYCETAAAISQRWHLRPAEGPRKLSGGVKGKTLCGLPVTWDIDRAVIERDLQALACVSCRKKMETVELQLPQEGEET